METLNATRRIKKYTDYLIEFNELVKSGKRFNVSELVSRHHVDSQVNTAILNIGYAVKSGHGMYQSKLKNVEPIHGRRVAGEISRMGSLRKNYKKQNEPIDEELHNQEDAIVDKPIPKVFVNGKDFTGQTLYIYIMRGDFFYSDNENWDVFKHDYFPLNTH